MRVSPHSVFPYSFFRRSARLRRAYTPICLRKENTTGHVPKEHLLRPRCSRERESAIPSIDVKDDDVSFCVNDKDGDEDTSSETRTNTTEDNEYADVLSATKKLCPRLRQFYKIIGTAISGLGTDTLPHDRRLFWV